MSRQAGFYWVKMSYNKGEWTIIHWLNGDWEIYGPESEFTKSCILEIDERRITREPDQNLLRAKVDAAITELDNAVKAFFLKNGLPIPDHYEKQKESGLGNKLFGLL